MRKIKTYRGGTLHVLEKGETANPNGRPRKLFSSLAQEMKDRGFENVTSKMIRDAYEILLGLDKSTLKEIEADESRPQVQRIIADYLQSKIHGIDIIETLLDRAHGKAVQKVATDLHVALDDKSREAVEHLIEMRKKEIASQK